MEWKTLQDLTLEKIIIFKTLRHAGEKQQMSEGNGQTVRLSHVYIKNKENSNGKTAQWNAKTHM